MRLRTRLGYDPGITGGYGWGHGGAFGMIGILLWWVLIILGIVLLAKWLFTTMPGCRHAPRSCARDTQGALRARRDR